MPEDSQNVRVKIGKSKGSLTITLNKQLRDLGFEHGDAAKVEWNQESIVVRRLDGR